MRVISERIKNLRLEKGLTQKQVAMYLNIAPNSFQGYESGRTGIVYDNLIKLCRLFDVSADYILGISDVLTRANNGDVSLNDDEIALIEAYKKLPRDYQFEIKGYINGILKSSGISP